MFSILRRLKQTVLDPLLAPAEDPRKVFIDAHQRQQELLVKVHQAQGKIGTYKKQLEAQVAAARNKLVQLEGPAGQALPAAEEGLTRFARQLREIADEELKTLEQQVQELQQEQRILSLVEQRLVAQIEALLARQKAEAHVRIQEVFGDIYDKLDSLDLEMERAEQRTEEIQARAAELEQRASSLGE